MEGKRKAVETREEKFRKVLQKLDAKEKFEKVEKRIRKNDVIANYYAEYAEELLETEGARVASELSDGALKLFSTCKTSAAVMPKCCSIWELDYYELQEVKDVVKTNLCRNRFCDNCQNMLSIKRDRKYAPYLDLLLQEYEIDFITFTVPNVYPEELKGTIDKMFYNFGYVTRIFSGNAKIKGYDFSTLGYLGGVRALEITKNEKDGTFHPHFHCLFVFRKGVRLADHRQRKHINRFSFDNPDIEKSHKKEKEKEPRRFTDFEILLQKLWRLKYDGKRVTKKNIESLGEGYSVVCKGCSSEAAGRYKDVFKYATKGVFKTSDEAEIFNGSEDFRALLPALHGRRVIQGYGLLNALDFEASEEANERQERDYMKVLEKLREVEAPKRTFSYLHQIQEELKRKKVTYISKSSLHELTEKDYDKL